MLQLFVPFCLVDCVGLDLFANRLGFCGGVFERLDLVSRGRVFDERL